MAVSYKDTSPYFRSSIVNGSYLGFWTERTIALDGTEQSYAIEPQYENRPDLLSYKFYKTVDLWWVFMVANPDKVFDSLNDLVSGLTIIIPNERAII